MDILTTKQLAEELAGGDSYIRTKKNIVKGLAITTDLNPEAPEIIVVGSGPRKIANAKLFVSQKQYVPVYVKQAVNAWKYMGKYKADRYSQDLDIIEKHRKSRPLAGLDGVLFLSPEPEDTVSVQPKNFPDPIQRKKVESAAINYVVAYFTNQGYKIIDRQKDNCGYDLFIEKGKKCLKIEVKGTSLNEQRFFLSRNERKHSVDPNWRLAIVSDALTTPVLAFYNAREMEEEFDLEPLCWECKLR